MLNDLWVFVLAVFFVAINGITQLSWAASLGFAMKPTAFAYMIGVAGNVLTGSVTPISGQSATLTTVSFIKKINQRVAALILAGVAMAILGAFGLIERISDFAGPAVVFGMMAGVGIFVSGVGIDMLKQDKRTGIISMVSALAIFALTRDLVYTIAGSVMLATLDFAVIQKKRMDLGAIAKENGHDADSLETENFRFWTKKYWSEFKIIKPDFFSLTTLMWAAGFMCLHIGTNIAFGRATAGIAGTTQNLDHLTVINGLADIPSVMFGGAPLGAIISGTASAPWPVLAGIIMMLLCAVLLLLGLVTKMCKYIPTQSIAGFLFVLGFFMTFMPNVRNAFATGNIAEAAVAMSITALTKNPFIGLVAGIAVRYIGYQWFGLVV
ncbi:MAG: xanthine/uracil permease [Defluviitaleaceae bacterium]|nr:xanthine/uracil permease [Defluviitaleaceae bacterium]